MSIFNECVTKLGRSWQFRKVVKVPPSWNGFFVLYTTIWPIMLRVDPVKLDSILAVKFSSMHFQKKKLKRLCHLVYWNQSRWESSKKCGKNVFSSTLLIVFSIAKKQQYYLLPYLCCSKLWIKFKSWSILQKSCHNVFKAFHYVVIASAKCLHPNNRSSTSEFTL